MRHDKSQDISFVPHLSSKYPFESTFGSRISPHEDFELKFDSDVYLDLNKKFILMTFQKNHWDTKKVPTFQ